MYGVDIKLFDLKWLSHYWLSFSGLIYHLIVIKEIQLQRSWRLIVIDQAWNDWFDWHLLRLMSCY